VSPYSPCPKSVSLEQVPLRTSTRILLHSEAFVLHESEVCHDFSIYCTASRPNWKKFLPSISRAAIISSQQFYFPTCVRWGSTTDEPHNPLCNFVAERGHGSSLTPDRSTLTQPFTYIQQDPLHCIPAPKNPTHPPCHRTLHKTPPLDSLYILYVVPFLAKYAALV